MQATALTLALVGLDAHPVRVEVDSGRGPSMFHLVGLAEASVRESRVRVKSALAQIGTDLGEYVITVNLAPADLRKSGGGFDVAIAAAALAALGKVPASALEGTVLLGELSLTGAIRPVRGVLPALIGAAARGIRRAIVPRANAREASAVPAVEVLIADHLAEVAAHLKKSAVLEGPGDPPDFRPGAVSGEADLADVRGQKLPRRAIEVAAAGAHNLIMMGPPGSGKTMLARRLPSVMPPLTFDEALEVTAIHSVAGMLSAERGVVTSRPFRAPHHTVSSAGLVGGGDPIRPGEVSLAHNGCLFLDELLEFRRAVLEALRQPLEDGVISLARARARVTFPARPMLVAAVNPCPCGHHGDPSRRCECTPDRVRAYRARLSGPLLDRIDLQIPLTPVHVADLQAPSAGESSAAVRERVLAARWIQTQRCELGEVLGSTNAELTSRDLERVATPDAGGANLLVAAVERHGLSARAYGKVLRVARTIADLEGSDAVTKAHVSDAIQMRTLDREIDPSLSAVAS